MCEQLVNPHKIIRSWIQLRSSSVYKFSFQVKDLTYPVDVILTVVGVVIVDDKLDIIHVKTSGINICGHQEWEWVVPTGGHCCAGRMMVAPYKTEGFHRVMVKRMLKSERVFCHLGTVHPK